jgi:hypothetical protein
MEFLAVSIFLCVVLYLVDKNHVWRGFWIVVGAITTVGLLAIGGLYWYDRHKAAQRIDFSKYEEKNVPETLPADFNNWDKDASQEARSKTNGWFAKNAPTSSVPIFDPKGVVRDIPVNEVPNALKNGGHLAVWNQDLKGNWCLTPVLPPGAKLGECTGANIWKPVDEKPKFDPSKPYSKVSQ